MKTFLYPSVVAASLCLLSLSAPAQTELQPVRQAHLNLTVYKTSFIKNEGGTFDQKTEVVCNKTGLVPVYDERSSPDSPLAPVPKTICNSTLGGKPAEITFTGRLEIENIKDLAPNKQAVVKMLYSNLWLSTPSTDAENPGQPLTYSIFATKELDLHSMMQELWPNYHESCSTPPGNPVVSPIKTKSVGTLQTTCTIDLPEFFGADAEVEDAP